MTWVSGWLCCPVFSLREAVHGLAAAPGLFSLTLSVCPAGSVAVLGGDEDMQENISSEAFRCSLCSTLCCSQLKLQEHLLSCHVETRQESREEEQASTSYTVTSTSHRSTDEDEIMSGDTFLTDSTWSEVHPVFVESLIRMMMEFVQLRCILGEFAAFIFQTKLDQHI